MEDEKPVSVPDVEAVTEENKGKLSKNAMKRLLKQQRHLETKEEWKKKNREKRKEARKRRVQTSLEQGIFIISFSSV